MIIGVLKEIKKGEFRVGMTPYGVEELKADGHTILIETGAGEGSDFSDEEYRYARSVSENLDHRPDECDPSLYQDPGKKRH